MGLLEETSSAAEPGPLEEAFRTSSGCQLALKLEGRELPQMSESNEHPEQVSPASWGLLEGRSTDGQGCMDVVVSPLHILPHGDIGASDTWVLA